MYEIEQFIKLHTNTDGSMTLLQEEVEQLRKLVRKLVLRLA